MASWQISGQYMETCNCALLCPCITSNMAAAPSQGDCKAAVALRIDQGFKDDTRLDGLCFAVMLHAPGPMAEGNITVGLIVDQAASDRQVAAIADIASGAAGGPMAALAPLVGRFAGIEQRPMRFDAEGLNFAVTAGELLDQACEGLPSAVKPEEAICVDNVAHPVNSRLSIAKATRSSFHAFGMDWDDTSGTRNGHFAPFAWSG